ncbi:MAG TPA: hypothetical protein IAB27_05165 [Candidatus Coprosoma intestinipullorum]|uniref:Uncharacterized protein n=1 Tax=Candidatus Coprosoma intestinipullorum TaxID=2840752 RepID=A0A9D1CYG8_9FIRM|nr:hypothetical protein [Candidatus Coprosoma intestinipullorum]
MENTKRTTVMVVLLIIFMIANVCFALFENNDYENRKEAGNERWKQVEKRIIAIENRVENLENGRSD